MNRKFVVVAIDSIAAINVERVIKQFDNTVAIFRMGNRLTFWTKEKEIDTRTFRTMSGVQYAMIVETTPIKSSTKEIDNVQIIEESINVC